MTSQPISSLVRNAPEITLACNFEHHDAVVVVNRADVQQGVYDGRWGKTCFDDPKAIKRPIKRGA